MKRLWGAVLAVSVAMTTGCDDPDLVDFVNITSIGETPLEVDCVPDDSNMDGVVTGFVAEEITVNLQYSLDPNRPQAVQDNAVFTEYRLEYSLQSSGGEEFPPYENGVSIILRPGDSGTFPIRAVSFVQKDVCQDLFAGDDVNATATLTMTGHEDDDVDQRFQVRGEFDIIFANFVEGL